MLAYQTKHPGFLLYIKSQTKNQTNVLGCLLPLLDPRCFLGAKVYTVYTKPYESPNPSPVET